MFIKNSNGQVDENTVIRNPSSLNHNVYNRPFSENVHKISFKDFAAIDKNTPF